jgi:hypothetical protein
MDWSEKLFITQHVKLDAQAHSKRLIVEMMTGSVLAPNLLQLACTPTRPGIASGRPFNIRRVLLTVLEWI